MRELKCVNCGGQLTFDDSLTVGKCKFCGTDVLLPANKNTTSSVIDLRNVDPKEELERGYTALKSGDNRNASISFDKVLLLDPYCAKAYMGKLLLEKGLRDEGLLVTLFVEHHAFSFSVDTLTDNRNFAQALQYADGDYRQILESYDKAFRYNSLINQSRYAIQPPEFEWLAGQFEQLQYMGSEMQAKALYERANTMKAKEAAMVKFAVGSMIIAGVFFLLMVLL